MKLPNITGGFTGSFIDIYYREKGVQNDALKFSPISEEETLKHLHNLSIRKATGLDGLSARFIKEGAIQITAPITRINLSLYSGCVPEDMKTERAVPLYKK